LDREIKELEEKTEVLGFWNDQKLAQVVLKDLKLKQLKIEHFKVLEENLDDIFVMDELAEEGEILEGFSDEIQELYQKIDAFRIETLLSGEYDSNNAIISLHPGAGGTESQDWAEMLLRMYTRWAEKKGYKIKILDLQPGEGAGIKSATLLIEGINAYGYLKTERGVHRLVRISPFDSSGRRHTSFASLDVMPEVDDTVEIEILPEDIRIDTYRASGAGGQHVNKTDSAVRITHLSTRIVVQCQNERSQHQNKEAAMTMLKGKLIEIMEQEKMDRIDDIKGDYSQIAWGSQIRSYVFHPYNMVKDHRTNVEIGNVSSVMDGDLDMFMNAFLNTMV
jgi:peptide chain release factor 2